MISFLNLCWNSSKSESELEAEFKSYDEYSDKLNNLIAICGLKSKSYNGHSLKTGLKPPNLTLPEFKSSIEENIDKFFQEFEDSTEVYKFTDKDKFVLLKKQVSGPGSILLSSIELRKYNYTEVKK